MDKCLGEAAESMGMEWDKDKEWKDGIHLGVNLNRRKHQKYRTQKTRAVWGMIRSLTRLLPREKAKVVVGQLLPMLLYGAELHDTPWEEGARLVGEMSRWAVGGYRGSSRERIEALTGIVQLERQMVVKKVRWAGSVYGRHIPVLRRRAEGILREYLDEEVDLAWMTGGTGCITGVTVEKSHNGGEYSDGSRRDRHTAAATTKKGFYLGQVATVMDAEMLGVAMGWEQSKKVATDSQAAIGRIQGLGLNDQSRG